MNADEPRDKTRPPPQPTPKQKDDDPDETGVRQRGPDTGDGKLRPSDR